MISLFKKNKKNLMKKITIYIKILFIQKQKSIWTLTILNL